MKTCTFQCACKIHVFSPSWPHFASLSYLFRTQGHTAGKVSAHEHMPLEAFPTMAANCSDHSSSQATEPREAATPATATTGALYGWRMHTGQGTRNSGRCSTENLRLCKVFYMAQDPAGPAHGRHVQVRNVETKLSVLQYMFQRTKIF